MTQEFDPNAVQAGRSTRNGCGWILAIVAIALLVVFMAGLVMGLGDEMLTAGEKVGNNIAALFNSPNEVDDEPTQAEQPQAEQPATADEPVAVEQTVVATQPQAEQPAVVAEQANFDNLVEIDCDDKPLAFNETWDDDVALMPLWAGEFATSSSDPGTIYIDGIAIYQTALGHLALVENGDDIEHELGYTTSWNVASEHLNVHACRWSGPQNAAVAKAANWQQTEDKPDYIYVFIDKDGQVTVVDLSVTDITRQAELEQEQTEAVEEADAILAPAESLQAPTETEDEPSCGHYITGDGYVHISGDSADVTIDNITYPAPGTRFTLYSADPDAIISLAGVDPNNVWWCNDPGTDAVTNYDNAPLRYNVDANGVVTQYSVAADGTLTLIP